MSGSKIFEALEAFKAEYAWDKSLVTGHTPAPVEAPDLGDYSMRDFVKAAQAKQSARASRESS